MSDEPAPLSSSQKAKGSFSSLVSQGSRKGFAKLPPGNELSRNKSIQSLKNGIDTKLKSVITALEDVIQFLPINNNQKTFFKFVFAMMLDGFRWEEKHNCNNRAHSHSIFVYHGENINWKVVLCTSIIFEFIF